MYKVFSRVSRHFLARNTRILCNSRDRYFQVAEVKRSFSSSKPPLAKFDKMAGSEGSSQHKHTNRLAQEKSPYLLQHAHNPVDWYPWGDEAIQKAKDENKLIFLSVGYSTCHWCHVMEHESFENEQVAEIMNENFVNIKVDREERPDIDKIYMNFVVMVNGSGGWPMSVWLTPDLAPITAGTYFPPNDRWGMPGFKTVLNALAEKWQTNQDSLKETGSKIIEAIRKSLAEKSPDAAAPSTPEHMLNQAIAIFKRNFDQDYGGFGSHPKFPEVAKLNFLLHAYMVKKDMDVLELVLRTLKKIGNGGIHDHVFGGFARYSVDRKWHVPHFEKMLYDQGQLMSVYAHTYQVTKDKYYLNTADKIFNYIMKDLRHPCGGFYAGEDADSLPTASDTVKVEGAFYAWTYSEIRDLILKNSSKFDMDANRVFEIYSYHYDIQEAGNIEPASDPHGHLTAKNIFIVRKSASNTCDRFDLEPEQLEKILQVVNCILHEVRDERPRPHLDTKILTAWNGLVLSGLSKLANCGSDRREEYRKAASDLIEFVRCHLYDKENKRLLRSCYGHGTQSDTAEVLREPIGGFLDDYAFFIRGLLDYYKCSLDLSALEWAKELQEKQDSLFWDEQHGGYFYSEANSPNVIVRLKEDHDGAEPCGNSVTGRNLLLLSSYYDEHSYKERAQKLFEYFNDVSPFGYILPEMMSALLLLDRGLVMMGIVGPDTEVTQQFIRLGQSFYIPGLVIAHLNEDDPTKNIPKKSAEKFRSLNGKPTVYVCHNKVCQLPITVPDALEEHLKENYLVN